MIAKEKKFEVGQAAVDEVIDFETGKLMEDIFHDSDNSKGFNFEVLEAMSKVVEGFTPKQSRSIALLWVKVNCPRVFNDLPDKVQSMAWEVKTEIKMRTIWSELI